MAFNKNRPVNYTEADADEVRANLVALAVHHKGPTAPDAPELGYVWLDDALADNWKLRAYTKNGEAAEVWVSLFDHMESTPVPSSGGGGGGFTPLSSVAEDRELLFDITPYVTVEAQVPIRMQMPVGGVISVRICAFEAEGIEESGPTLNDPSLLVTTVNLRTTGAYRELFIYWNADNIPAHPATAWAVVSWTWNGVTFTFTYTVSKLEEPG